jgi:tetratricopeptide (TPR) repeat protein
MTLLLASAVGDFFLYALLGLGALPFTAFLDKKIGKEKALLIYAVGLLGVILIRAPEGAGARSVKAGSLKDLPKQAEAVSGDPFEHPGIDLSRETNIFQKYSDTRPLPPITLQTPPWIELAFPLPPTVPGPAPGYQQALQGVLPTMAAASAPEGEEPNEEEGTPTPAADASSLPDIPDRAFNEFEPKPEDIYDWMVTGSGGRMYIYITALKPEQGAKWVKLGEPGFHDLAWILTRKLEGYENLYVRWATVGPASMAEKKLAPTDVIAARRSNLTDASANENSEREWKLARTVQNLYREALRAESLKPDLSNATDKRRLMRAANRMADVGETGKRSSDDRVSEETVSGWELAVTLLDRALAVARESNLPAERAEVLLKLLEAHRAMRNEDKILKVLAEFARTTPTSHLAWSWLGDVMLDIGIPQAALRYHQAALDRNRSYAEAHMGVGDAYVYVGNLPEALKAFERASGNPEGRLRKAECLLRMGKIKEAAREADSMLLRDGANVRALLVRGGAQYAAGELEGALATFLNASTLEGGEQRRAQATYNLGLTCVRLGRAADAAKAFEACRRALEFGSIPGDHPRDFVSPALGRAFAALAAGKLDTVSMELNTAGQEAPRNPYVRFLAGVLAHKTDNTATAVRALEVSKGLDSGYAELDGWLAWSYLQLGEQQSSTGADTAADTFRRALAYAERAARRERAVDKNAYEMALRLALVQLRSQHLSARERLSAARDTVQAIVDRPATKDQPAAWALRGWANYGLGGEENVDRSLQDFQKVVNDIGDAKDHPWATWAEFSRECLAAIKRWRSLEEKTVEFTDASMLKEWDPNESGGVKQYIYEDGSGVQIRGKAKEDGGQENPTWQMQNTVLFDRYSFEEVSMLIRVPATQDGRATNSVTFGVQVMSGKGSARAKMPGVGVFYDKGHLAFRMGGGQKKDFQAGLIRREGDDVVASMWPGGEKGEWVQLRIVRTDADNGSIEVWLRALDVPEDQATKVLDDRISSFKRSRGAASLWIGGWGTEAATFHDIEVKDVRVIRRKGGR